MGRPGEVFALPGFLEGPDSSRRRRFEGADADRYARGGRCAARGVSEIHARMMQYLREKLPRPESMKPEAYARNIAARAFDVARYLLFWGVPTNVGQVTSIRTLEKQIRRLRVSEFAEVRELGVEMAQACAEPPECVWDNDARRTAGADAGAPCGTGRHRRQSRTAIWRLGRGRICGVAAYEAPAGSIWSSPTTSLTEIVATLLYPVCDHPFRAIYRNGARLEHGAQRWKCSMSRSKSRGSRDELLRGFRGGQYCFDMLIDIGAYRDMHRHRRCHQYRQAYTGMHGYEVPDRALAGGGAEAIYRGAMDAALRGDAGAARARRASICCLSGRGRGFSSRWTSPRWNIFRAFAAA